MKDMTKFFALGVRAFKEGKPCAPAMDPECVELLKIADVPFSPALKAWINGWTLMNLKD